MRGLLYFLLGFFVVFYVGTCSSQVFGQEMAMSVGVGYVSGHTHGGDDCIGPGMSGTLSLAYGVLEAELMQLSYKRSREHAGSSWQQDYVLAGCFAPRFELVEGLRIYPIVGPAVDFRQSKLGVFLGGGLEWWFSKKVALVPAGWTLRQSKRNFTGYGLMLRHSF